MKILHLTLHKKWFDLIASGEKKEEYRELKTYWHSRLLNQYDEIHFRNGYRPDSPFMRVKWLGCQIDQVCNRYIIHLGEVLEVRK